MKKLYSKRNVLVVTLLLLVGATAFLVYRANAVPAYLQAIYPNSDIRVLETDKKFSVDSREVYSKPVTVGDAILYMVVEVMPEQESRYKFYSADPIPQLLKEVSITTPFDYDVDSDILLERTFWQKDITGDGIDELFIKFQSPSGMSPQYKVLRYGEGMLSDIQVGGLEFVTMDDADYEDGYIALTDHGTYVRGKTRYLLEEDTLKEVGRVSFFWSEEMGDACDVRIETQGNRDAITQRTVEQIEDCNIWTEDFDPYWSKAPELSINAFTSDLNEAIEDPKWEKLANVYKSECDRFGNEVGRYMENPTFRGLVESLEPAKISSDGTSVFIVPCMLHAYQSSQLVAYYDGQTYTPLLVTSITEDRERHSDYRVVEIYYNKDSDTFGTYYKGRGLGDCGSTATYKLTDRELSLQKFEADWECDGEYESEVVFDINS